MGNEFLFSLNNNLILGNLFPKKNKRTSKRKKKGELEQKLEELSLSSQSSFLSLGFRIRKKNDDTPKEDYLAQFWNYGLIDLMNPLKTKSFKEIAEKYGYGKAPNIQTNENDGFKDVNYKTSFLGGTLQDRIKALKELQKEFIPPKDYLRPDIPSIYNIGNIWRTNGKAPNVFTNEDDGLKDVKYKFDNIWKTKGIFGFEQPPNRKKLTLEDLAENEARKRADDFSKAPILNQTEYILQKDLLFATYQYKKGKKQRGLAGLYNRVMGGINIALAYDPTNLITAPFRGMLGDEAEYIYLGFNSVNKKPNSMSKNIFKKYKYSPWGLGFQIFNDLTYPLVNSEEFYWTWDDEAKYQKGLKDYAKNFPNMDPKSIEFMYESTRLFPEFIIPESKKVKTSTYQGKKKIELGEPGNKNFFYYDPNELKYYPFFKFPKNTDTNKSLLKFPRNTDTNKSLLKFPNNTDTNKHKPGSYNIISNNKSSITAMNLTGGAYGSSGMPSQFTEGNNHSSSNSSGNTYGMSSVTPYGNIYFQVVASNGINVDIESTHPRVIRNGYS